MNLEDERKVWELRQKGWSYEEIALRLQLEKEKVEKCCNKKESEKEQRGEEELVNKNEELREAEKNEELEQEITEKFFSPLKKVTRI